MSVFTAVEDLVVRRVRASGPISFAEYVDLALYSDPMGYYRRNVPGPCGDFHTSPTLTPLFGRLLARQLEQMWHQLGFPGTFRVTEAGGGNGDLALSVLESVPAELQRVLTWCFVEPIPSVELLQRARLEHLPAETQWKSSLEELEPADGVVLANEVLDNMPFHVLEVSAGGLTEIRVGLEEDRLVEVPVGLTADSPLAGLAQAAMECLEPGDRFEVRPRAEDWCLLAAETLMRGYLAIIDYGDTEPDIWIHRPAGTAVTYREEQLGFSLLDDPGEADITAHVNFSALSRAAAGAGMTVAPPVTQRDWLKSLGLTQVEAGLRDRQSAAELAGDHAAALGLLAERGRAGALAHKGGLGDLLVLISAKGVTLP